MSVAIASDVDPVPTSRLVTRSGLIAKDGHNAGIDTLRAIAAAMVVIFHMDSADFPVLPGQLALVGALGVNLFFTLSGFLIARAVLVQPAFDRRKYLRNRGLRILPNYYICCLFMLFVVEGRTIANATPGFLAFNLGAHVILMHGWFGSIYGSIAGPLWTISSEAIFYLLIAFAAPCLRSKQGWLVPVLMFVVALTAKYLMATKVWHSSTGRMNPLCLWDQFAFGIVGAQLSLLGGFWRHRPLWLWVAAVGGSLLLGGCIYRQYAAATALHAEWIVRSPDISAKIFAFKFADDFYRTKGNLVWFPCVFSAGSAMLLVALTSGFHRFNAWLRRTPLPWMGKVSYSTYLYHMAVLLCLNHGFNAPPPGSVFSRRWAASTVAIIGIYTLSAFCFHFFEKPWLARKSLPPLAE